MTFLRPATLSLALLSLAAIPTPAAAQDFKPPAPADERAMRIALDQSRDGFNQGDLAKHVAFYVDSVRFMTSAGPRTGKQGVIDAFSKSYFKDGKPIQQLSFDQVALRALGPDHALMTGNFHLIGGGLAEQSGWFTLIWERTAAGWKVLHDHSS